METNAFAVGGKAALKAAASVCSFPPSVPQGGRARGCVMATTNRRERAQALGSRPHTPTSHPIVRALPPEQAIKPNDPLPPAGLSSPHAHMHSHSFTKCARTRTSVRPSVRTHARMHTRTHTLTLTLESVLFSVHGHELRGAVRREGPLDRGVSPTPHLYLFLASGGKSPSCPVQHGPCWSVLDRAGPVYLLLWLHPHIATPALQQSPSTSWLICRARWSVG